MSRSAGIWSRPHRPPGPSRGWDASHGVVSDHASDGAAAARPPLEIPSLDGLRAIAFLIVFVAHARLVSAFPGNFGVTLFFFLSGYLITTLLRMEHERTGRIALGHFYLRRTLRILPPFYIVLFLTVGAVWAGWLVGEADIRAVALQAVHLSNYQLIIRGHEGYPLGTFPYWSLAVEEHFYLAFPVIYMVALRLAVPARAQWIGLGVVCAIVLAWRVTLVTFFDSSQYRTYLASDTRVDSILFGVMLAVFANPVCDRAVISEKPLKWVLFPLACAVILGTFVFQSMFLKETIRYSLQGIALWPIFTALIMFPQWGLVRILNFRWMKFLGSISYTMYLCHEIVIYNVYEGAWGNEMVQASVALMIVAALATLMYVAVERPCARLRRRLHAGVVRRHGEGTSQADPRAGWALLRRWPLRLLPHYRAS